MQMDSELVAKFWFQKINVKNDFLSSKLHAKYTIDALPNSLIDSIANPNVKTTKGKIIEGCSPTCSISGVERRAWALGWGLERMTKGQLFTRTYKNQTTSWLLCNWSIYGAWMNHGPTQIHKIHHGPNLGETITFPFIVFCLAMGLAPKCHFVPGLPSLVSRNSWNWNFYNFEGP